MGTLDLLSILYIKNREDNGDRWGKLEKPERWSEESPLKILNLWIIIGIFELISE